MSDLAISRLDMLWAFGEGAMQHFTQAYKTQMLHLDYGNQTDEFVQQRTPPRIFHPQTPSG